VQFVSYEPALGLVDFERWSDTGLECSRCKWAGSERKTRETFDMDEGSVYRCAECDSECAHTPLDERLDW
jgi:hypothetical protein